MMTFPVSKYAAMANSQMEELVPGYEGLDEYDRACALLGVFEKAPDVLKSMMRKVGKQIRSDHPAPTDMSELHDYSQLVMKTEMRVCMGATDHLAKVIMQKIGMTVEQAKAIIAKKFAES